MSAIDKRPRIGKGTFISEHAVVIGNVIIGDNVFVAPHATIRCDEPGSEVIIGNGCNIQDNVVIHGIVGSTVRIGDGTTVGHGSIVHGPCEVGERTFIGFGAVLFRCKVGKDCAVLHRAVVLDAILPDNKMVSSGTVLQGGSWPTWQDITDEMRAFTGSVQAINEKLAKDYLSTEDGVSIDKD